MSGSEWSSTFPRRPDERLVAQTLALSVNAWPRTVDAPDEFKAGDVENTHPFASLGSLKISGE